MQRKLNLITMLKRIGLVLCAIMASITVGAVDASVQFFYDFGSLKTACANQRPERFTSTVELFHPDQWGNTYFFVDFDYSVDHFSDRAQNDPRHCAFGGYWEIARSLNFWKESKAKDLGIHIEYNGGLGNSYNGPVVNGYGINNAVLIGLDYFLHTPNYKNTFTIELMFKYIADDYNMWGRLRQGKWTQVKGNDIPLQFTFIWSCKDLFKAKGLTFSGFIDVWGQRIDYGKDPSIPVSPYQSVIFISEPQLWYSVGQWFKCPNLCIGTEVEFSYNFTGKGFMCNPCVGLKWDFL